MRKLLVMIHVHSYVMPYIINDITVTPSNYHWQRSGEGCVVDFCSHCNAVHARTSTKQKTHLALHLVGSMI